MVAKDQDDDDSDDSDYWICWSKFHKAIAIQITKLMTALFSSCKERYESAHFVSKQVKMLCSKV